MTLIVFAIVLVVVALVGPSLIRASTGSRLTDETVPGVRALTRVGCLLLSLFLVGLTSWTVVGDEQVGHLKRVYGGQPMPPGQVIALANENGPQAEVLPPGFHLRPLLNVIFEVERKPLIVIPEGKYGLLIAHDGVPLRPGQFIADAWPAGRFQTMLEAERFLREGGQRGPQLTVLPPGKYRLNQYLFEVKMGDALSIEAGEVGVVKSNVQEVSDCGRASPLRSGALAAPLVARGCIGVWSEPLMPGRYYLNHLAYSVTRISTRASAWEHKGGHKRRFIDVTVDQKGQITQTERSVDTPVPSGAEPAITTRIEGWEVPLDVRVLVQVPPEEAPFVVASVGGVNDVAEKILTPIIRSAVRNVVEAPGRRVIDVVERRAELEAQMEAEIRPEGEKAGVAIRELRLGAPMIPPELLVAKLREQLAGQMEPTFEREKQSQAKRIETEKARATADRQDQLVASEIEVKVEEQRKAASRLRGEGRRAELEALAAGQREQAAVLGQDRVAQLEALREILAAARQEPQIVKVPSVLVQSNGTTLEGAAAILGASNLISAVRVESSSSPARGASLEGSRQ